MTEFGLLEREADVHALRVAVEQCAAGRGSVVLLQGPAGIGKTSLLDGVREQAQGHVAQLLRARASELDRGFAFGVVHQLLEPLLRSLAAEERAAMFVGAAGRAEALFSAAEPEGDPGYGVLSGLYWLIANLAERAPLVLCVDDLHWADVPSLRMLEFLGRRVEELPVLVVGTLRPAEPGAPAELLAELSAGPATTTRELRPLSEDAIAAVLAGALGAAPEQGFQDEAASATGGNPLLVAVLASEAFTHGMRGLDTEGTALAELGARGVAPIIDRRLRTLGPDAVTVARAAAIIGERALMQDMCALTEMSDDAVRLALDQLDDARILAGGGWTFVHPLVRAAVEETIPWADYMRLHRDAAKRLRERGARPAEVALHWLATDPAGDQDALADLRAAALEAAGEGASETAADLMRRALAEPPQLHQRAAVLLELGELELRVGAPEAAGRLREALETGLGDADAVRARAALAGVLIHTDPAAAIDEIQQAYDAATERGLRLRLESSLMETLIFVNAFAAPRDARFAAARTDPDASPVMLAHLALQEACAGAPQPVVADLGRRAQADGDLVREVGPGTSTWNLLTHAYRFNEDAEASRALLTEGERLVRQHGLRAASAFVDQSWGYWHRDFGSVATGAARGRLGYDQMTEAGLVVTAPALAAIAAENLVLLDRADEAAALIDVPLGAAEDTFVEPYALSARGLVRAQLRDFTGAEADFRRVIAIELNRGWEAPFACRARLRLAELLAARGEREEALELTAHSLEVSTRAGTEGARGASLRVRALALQGDEALAALRESVDILAPGPMRLEYGRAALDLGSALRRAGARKEARELLRVALDLGARTESAWLARLARAELEASGARPRRERLGGVEALTPSERRIAELAAEGLSNREIAESLWVTRKTVEYHLGHVYGKLSIRSRAGLAGALGQPAEA